MYTIKENDLIKSVQLAMIPFAMVGFFFRNLSDSSFGTNRIDWATPLMFGMVPIVLALILLVIYPIIGIDFESDSELEPIIYPKAGYYISDNKKIIVKLYFENLGPRIDTGTDRSLAMEWEYIKTGLRAKVGNYYLFFWNGEDGEIDSPGYVMKRMEDEIGILWNNTKGYYLI